MKSKRPLFVLLIAFALSIGLRWQGLGSEHEGMHFWLDSHVLTTSQIWEEEGFFTYRGNLILSFPAEGNEFVPIPTFTDLFDEQGKLYYVSYPPLGLWMPHAAHQLLGLKMSLLSLRTWSLLLHFLTILILYHSLRVYGFAERLSLWLVLLYLFAPGPMYYQANIYFSEMLAQLWWLLCLWGFGYGRRRDFDRRQFWFWLLLSFVFVLTEWLSVLALGSLGLLWLWQKRGFKRLLPLVLGGSLALALTLWQYSQIAGLEVLWEHWTNRYAYRSGARITILAFLEEVVLKHPHRMYALLPGLSLLGLIFLRGRGKLAPWPAFLTLALIPYAAHALLFRNFSYLHDFSALKSGPFWILLSAYLLQSASAYWQRLSVLRSSILTGALLLLWINFGTQRYYLYAHASSPEPALGYQIAEKV
ncbi:MAG: hypothetical protein AAFQ87_10110, partial [Bacteroidota bacterium]